MGISLKKIILTIAAAVLSVIAFGWVIMMQNHATLVRNRAGDETLKLDEVAQTLEDIESGWNIIERRIRERYKVDATLSALALRNVIENNKEEAVALYSNGAVIGVEDGEIKAPEGIVRKFGLEADLFKGRYGLFQSPANENTLIVYGRISSGYYYVEWHEDTSIRKEAEESLDIPGILRKAEAAYGVYALCAAKDPDAEGGERILYSSDIFTDLEDSFADTLMQDLSAEGTDAGIPGESGTMSLHDGSFRYVKSPVPEIDGYLVLLSIQPNLYVKALSQRMFNVFEDVLDRRANDIGSIKSMLLGFGAYGAAMSGTGSAVFALFPDAEHAQWAAESLRPLHRETYVTKTISRLEV